MTLNFVKAFKKEHDYLIFTSVFIYDNFVKKTKRNRVTEDTVASLLYDVQWKGMDCATSFWDTDLGQRHPYYSSHLPNSCVCVCGGGRMSATYSLFCGDLQTVAELKKRGGGQLWVLGL